MNEHREEALVSDAVTVAVTDTAVVGQHEGRTELTLQNNDATNPVWLRLRTSPGTTPVAVANKGIKLLPGASWTTRTYRGPVNAIATGGSVVVLVTDI